MTTPNPTGDALKIAFGDKVLSLPFPASFTFAEGVLYVTGYGGSGDYYAELMLNDTHRRMLAEMLAPPPVSLDEVEVLKDVEALLCEGVEDSPTVREVLKRVRTRIMERGK